MESGTVGGWGCLLGEGDYELGVSLMKLVFLTSIKEVIFLDNPQKCLLTKEHLESQPPPTKGAESI